jgi:tRNA-2-methylthio-N6-dimethylallyladenosine synthase
MNNRDSTNPEGQRLRFHISTFGCQMNERDSEVLAGMLLDMGYQPADNMNDADIILLNTCCVRETAENKVWGRIGDLKVLKAKKPELILGICGCMTQQTEIGEIISKRAPHIDIVFGTHNIHELPELINQVSKPHKTIIDVWDSEGNIVENLPSKRVEGVKAYVAIMYGCNNFCTYCIVPYVRGRERSRIIKDVVNEIKDIVEQGYKEVMLLGQNVNSYGKDLEPQVDFADLLQEIEDIKELERIRYMTSHPRDFTDHLIDVIASSKKVCEQFHLPVQAGSNRILKLMNRGYTKEDYLTLVNKIKAQIPSASITTDLIVGFPGESGEDFDDTIDLIQKVKFDAAFTFVYNKRSGTPAAEMADQISERVKSERIQKLIKQLSQISKEINKAEMGKIHEVLIEGFNRANPAMLEARTRTNKIVLIPGNTDMIGKIVHVKIIDIGTWHLDGEIINQN